MPDCHLINLSAISKAFLFYSILYYAATLYLPMYVCPSDFWCCHSFYNRLENCFFLKKRSRSIMQSENFALWKLFQSKENFNSFTRIGIGIKSKDVKFHNSKAQRIRRIKRMTALLFKRTQNITSKYDNPWFKYVVS